MRRKPLSFMFIGVLATLSLANAAYADVLIPSPPGGCKKCQAQLPSSFALPTVSQPSDGYSNFSQGPQKQISSEPPATSKPATSEPLAMNNYGSAPSYFGDEDPIVEVTKSSHTRERHKVVREYEEGEPVYDSERQKAKRHYEEREPAYIREHYNVVREQEEYEPIHARVHHRVVNQYGEPVSTHARGHHKMVREYKEYQPVHARRHHRVVREYKEYQPVHTRQHHRVVRQYEEPLPPHMRGHANQHKGWVNAGSHYYPIKRGHRSQVLSLESPKYVMHHPKKHFAHQPSQITHVAPFRHIVAGSDINIVLNNATRPCIEVLSRDCCGRRLIGCRVKNGTLYLCDLTKRPCKTYSDPDPNTKACQVTTRPLQVIINANCIESVRLYEQSSIYAPCYRTARMAVKSYTSGTIMLNGALNPYNIEQYGSGFINIGTVNTNNLDITSEGPGLIRLAGRVDTLHIRGLVDAQIDAKFLRTRDAWVETSGFSEVAVTADNALDGYSTGSSYVYYYKTPQFFQPLTYEHANVMQMAYWN